MEEEKIFGRPEAAARRLTGLIEKNRSHLMAYLKRVTPIYGAYKTCLLYTSDRTHDDLLRQNWRGTLSGGSHTGLGRPGEADKYL